jgi:hypothetical protein
MRSVSGSKSTLAALAAETGVSSKAIAAFNPGLKTTRSGRLIAGQKLRIPDEDALAFARDVPNPSIEIYGSSETKSLTRGGFHVVRRGESLGGIAKRYGLTSAGEVGEVGEEGVLGQVVICEGLERQEADEDIVGFRQVVQQDLGQQGVGQEIVGQVLGPEVLEVDGPREAVQSSVPRPR